MKRTSDARTLDIGIVPPSRSDAGGYTNAAARDTFCVNTIGVINRIYDQSGKGNDLLQAAPGTFNGPAEGAFNAQPIADMTPTTISGHKAYGFYVTPGMGFSNTPAASPSTTSPKVSTTSWTVRTTTAATGFTAAQACTGVNWRSTTLEIGRRY